MKERTLLDDTLFMVVTDHGGTPGGSHGGDSEAETRVFFGAAGKTADSETPIIDGDNRDIAAIAACALRVECPESWTARVPTGVFRDVTGEERKDVSKGGKHETEDILSEADIAAIRDR